MKSHDYLRSNTAPLRKFFSEIRDEPNLLAPPPKRFGGIIYIVFYGMEELSGHYKHILLYADNGRLLHHGGPNKLPKKNPDLC